MYVGIKNGYTPLYRELMTEAIKATFDGKLEETIEQIPIKCCPEGKETNLMDSIESDRKIATIRLQTILGHDLKSVTGKEVTLKELAHQTLDRSPKQYVSLVAVIKEACHKCHGSKYQVTDGCEGCVARPCMFNCPKQAISRVDGKAVIDQDKCVDCGTCAKVCPFNAIQKKTTPCMDNCPVGAISKDADGTSVIDFDKCIYCGKCMLNCPFGAIVMPSQVIDVTHKIVEKKRPAIAMLAPAVMAMFDGTVKQLGQALKQLGFADIVEVAAGADVTSLMEAEEWIEHIVVNKDPLMTTSCCPAFYHAVHKHVPKLAKYVSHSGSPMHYTAEIVKKNNPDCYTVFVGPCVAKRAEGLRRPNVDYVLTAEEILCMINAKGINLKTLPDEDASGSRLGSKEAVYYCVKEGVTQAVLASVPRSLERFKQNGMRHIDHLVTHIDQLESSKLEKGAAAVEPETPDGSSPKEVFIPDGITAAAVKPVFIAPLDKKGMMQLKAYGEKPEKAPGNLIECMVCDGGCINGPGGIVRTQMGKAKIEMIKKSRMEFKDIEDVEKI
ncbi:Fe-hydrogenase, simple [Blattamonas nauphoetae]|uniref:Fe-hydrogenase, simple n=1 Tax=Blattamonas nauphoetae TaxID=2049346 RepID=A0ABQ9Y2L8_9EUKA|nr:Fe-hydrogenase, simple [Blattamonas nauphoetae]